MSPLQQEAAPTLLFVFSSYQTCWRHNGRRVLTTSSDGRAQFSTVNNTCGVTTVELCWQELWSDNMSNRIGRINSLFEHIFIIIFICSDKNTWCLSITCTFTCKHLKFTRNIYMMFIYDLYIYLTPQGIQVGLGEELTKKQLLRPKLAGVRARGRSKKIWDPLFISATVEASNFKFGIQSVLGK